MEIQWTDIQQPPREIRQGIVYSDTA